MSYILPDTNILLNDPKIIKTLIGNKHTVIIALTVLRELDNLKSRQGTGYHAREAIRMIDKEKKNPQLILTAKFVNNPILNFKKGDGCILSTALYYHQEKKQVIILTEDINMGLEAQAIGIKSARDLQEMNELIQADNNLEKRIPTDLNTENIKQSNMSFGTHGKELVDKVQTILGPNFEPKYNKTGVTFFGQKGRILKLVYTKERLFVEFNVPISPVPGLITLTQKEANDKKMGSCRWLYKGDSLSSVIRLIEEAIQKY